MQLFVLRLALLSGAAARLAVEVLNERRNPQEPHCKANCPTSLCHGGWSSRDGRCYKVSSAKTDYSEATSWCASQGAQLVSINDRTENDFVKKLCGVGQTCWLGITERQHTGSKSTSTIHQQWIWADGSTSKQNRFKRWNLYGTLFGEPNNGQTSHFAPPVDERFAIMDGGKWFDEVADYKARAACEMAAQAPTTAVLTTTIAAISTTMPVASPYLCYDGWSPWAGKCYKVDRVKLAYSNAEASCKSQGSGLVSISDHTENDFVRILCGPGRACWLGLREVHTTGAKDTPQADQQWMWADGSTPSKNSFSMWNLQGSRHSEPNNGRATLGAQAVDERCAVIDGGRWFDKLPEYEAYAMCEMPGQVALTTSTMVPTPPTTTAATTCGDTCVREANLQGWLGVCQSLSSHCNECVECHGKNTVHCPVSWLSYSGKCYKVNIDEKSNYFRAKSWCAMQHAQLVSIENAKENDFVWRICGTGTVSPIRDPLLLRRTSCWLGLTEKLGSNTPAKDQQWVWADGTTPTAWRYANWKTYNGDSYSVVNEPNNGREPGGQDWLADEGFTVMNQETGDMSGRWYDKPAAYQAHAVCELDPAELHAASSSLQLGSPTRMRGSHAPKQLDLQPSMSSA